MRRALMLNHPAVLFCSSITFHLAPSAEHHPDELSDGIVSIILFEQPIRHNAKCT